MYSALIIALTAINLQPYLFVLWAKYAYRVGATIIIVKFFYVIANKWSLMQMVYFFYFGDLPTLTLCDMIMFSCCSCLTESPVAKTQSSESEKLVTVAKTPSDTKETQVCVCVCTLWQWLINIVCLLLSLLLKF